METAFYQLPTLELLNTPFQTRETESDENLKRNKERIAYVLHSFDIQFLSIDVIPGPTISTYKITLEKGTRISQIKELEEDISLSLAGLGIRLHIPILGEYAIGIEIPNEIREMPSIREALESSTFQKADMKLPIMIGEMPNGVFFPMDLTEAKHIFISGRPGQGKTTLLHGMIASILFKKTPQEVKFIFMGGYAEFNSYIGLTKYIAQSHEGEYLIVSNESKAIQTLKSLYEEMMLRYELIKEANDARIQSMPYIVVVIKEFGDYIMHAGSNFEWPLCRLVSLSAKVGIHFIMSTERPSINIATENILTYFPTRIAFLSSCSEDSLTILNRTGAEDLLPGGDMLCLYKNQTIRLQCPQIEHTETDRIVYFVRKQAWENVPYKLPAIKKAKSLTTQTQEIILEAETGNAESQCRLGIMYYRGEELSQNKHKASEWLKKSAKQGFYFAKVLLEMIEEYEGEEEYEEE